MVKIWSELPAARTREQLADVATLIWVVFWGNLVWQLFQFLVGFAGVGRAVHEGGDNMIEGGRNLGDSLAGLPIVGSQARDIATGAFAAGGQPISELGTGLEQFVTIVSVVLTLMLALVTLGPWLIRYVPWRRERLQRVRSAHRAIRKAPESDAGTEQILAMRAMARLDYATLLDFTPDPLGDWQSGRHDRLARAELASVGLRPA
jgi:hypothetical protein